MRRDGIWWYCYGRPLNILIKKGDQNIKHLVTSFMDDHKTKHRLPRLQYIVIHLLDIVSTCDNLKIECQWKVFQLCSELIELLNWMEIKGIPRVIRRHHQLVHQGSISPTLYVQLLCLQIPKAQKDSQLKQLFALLGSARVKAARKHVDEIDPWFLQSVLT